MTVQRTRTGVVLVNGSPRKVDYDTLRKNMSQKEGFKNLTDSDLRKARERRYENQKHDYKVLPNGERGKGKAVYRPRRTR